MGIFLSRTWFIYARDKSDRWMEPLASTLSNEEDLEFHMARFKHYVFLLGLDNLDAEISKIYLYQNRRVAKCVKSGSEIRGFFFERSSLRMELLVCISPPEERGAKMEL